MGKPKHGPAWDRRDRRLLHKVWLPTVEYFDEVKKGHNGKVDALERALDKAEDEMGPPEEFEM